MSDIDTAVVKSLKALDPNRPIREADMLSRFWDVCFWGQSGHWQVSSLSLSRRALWADFWTPFSVFLWPRGVHRAFDFSGQHLEVLVSFAKSSCFVLSVAKSLIISHSAACVRRFSKCSCISFIPGFLRLVT